MIRKVQILITLEGFNLENLDEKAVRECFTNHGYCEKSENPYHHAFHKKVIRNRSFLSRAKIEVVNKESE